MPNAAPIPPRKKLIEVALPLEAINRESAREKSIRHGHPSTLHLWWARRPLAACRAVLFSSLVDDPSSDPQFRKPDGTVDEERAGEKRAELFNLIEELVKWENSSNPKVIDAARAEIARCVASRKIETGEMKKEAGWDFVIRRAKPDAVDAFLAEHAPPVLDPFCGGGSIPLEGQRLGLRAIGTDLNPVPVLITKALIELPSKFANHPPVNPEARGVSSKTVNGRNTPTQATLGLGAWKGAAGLADDVRYYGQWMRDEAQRLIGSLYPKVKVTASMARDRKDLSDYVGQELTVIAWIWARTVNSPNPAAAGAPVPLVRSFWLSTKEGKRAWAEPVLASDKKSYHFEVRSGTPQQGFDPKRGTVIRTGGTCLLTGQPIPFEHIRSEGKAGRMGDRLMAIVAEGAKGRVYLSPTEEHERIARSAKPKDYPDTPLPEQALSIRVMLYGMDRHYKLFTARQLSLLTTFTDLVNKARSRIRDDGGTQEYADAVATYLGEAASKTSSFHCTLAGWRAKEGKSARAFGRQSIPMNWDFAEVNPFADAGGAFDELVDSAVKTIALLPAAPSGVAAQHDATAPRQGERVIVSTDPPYYDNVNYADLSDFYYVWLRRALSETHPALFRTLLTPKTEELIATPFRFGGSREAACRFFETGMGRAFERIREIGHGDFPLTVFYAFKQSETDDDSDSDENGESHEVPASTASTGWETMLEGLIRAGFEVTGTWPMRTESTVGLKNTANVLASSIVLVCHPRSAAAAIASRREFFAALKRELPAALRDLQSGNIAPVDLAQAAIGPGMAVYSRYSKVLETSGDRMGVRTALALINQVLDEVLAEQEGEYDADTRWCIKWFEQFAHADGPYGDAETLCKAMAVAVNGLVETGVVAAKGGKVRLFKRAELMGGKPETWDPATDDDILHWEVCQYLCWALETGGEQAAGDLLGRINAVYAGAAEVARDLAYRLYTLCERKKWAQEASAYNALVVAWPEIQKLAAKGPAAPEGSLYAR